MYGLLSRWILITNRDSGPIVSVFANPKHAGIKPAATAVALHFARSRGLYARVFRVWPAAFISLPDSQRV